MIYLYYKFSDLDNEHQFGIHNGNNISDVYVVWVWFYLGKYLANNKVNILKSGFCLYPYSLFEGKVIKSYKCNGSAKTVAKLICNAIKKKLKFYGYE
ncbi:MAG: hypothetical protein WC389_06635 [Lutibacter sp.]|jgi:hypothetical protein